LRKVTGVKQTLNAMNLQYQKESALGQRRVKDKLLENIKNLTPVDTGKARDGWYQTKNSIENDVEYVNTLNSGSSKREPLHFIEEAVLSTRGIKVRGTIVFPK